LIVCVVYFFFCVIFAKFHAFRRKYCLTENTVQEFACRGRELTRRARHWLNFGRVLEPQALRIKSPYTVLRGIQLSALQDVLADSLCIMCGQVIPESSADQHSFGFSDLCLLLSKQGGRLLIQAFSEIKMLL
jgi:hypothetical protein